MKSKLKLIAICHLLSAIYLPAFAQGTAFTYQGRLNSGSTPASGSFDIAFTLFATNTSGVAIAGPVTNGAVSVTNGLFIAAIDFGSGVFVGESNWLDIAVRTNGAATFTELAPRQHITPTPYAIFAGTASNLSGSISSANLGGGYTNAVNFNNGSDEFNGTFSGEFFGSLFVGGSFSGEHFGDGSGLFNLNASMLSSGTIPNAVLGNAWKITGNAGTSPGANFVGTTDNQPLELHVNGVRALRLEPTPTNGAVNVIGGSLANYVVPGIVGATIGGGGIGTFYPGANSNLVTFNYATIGGGYANLANGYAAVVAGGYQNANNGFAAFLGAGDQNTIVGAGGGDGSFLGGGYGNTNGGSAAVIVGGGANFIGNTANNAFIGGGGNNIIVGSYALPVFGVISGGYSNSIVTNVAYATIAGGFENTTIGSYGAIGGGHYNVTGNTNFDATEATVAGGAANTASGISSFIGGGADNLAYNNNAVVAGGLQNRAGFHAFVGSGYANAADGVEAMIGGGRLNDIDTNASDATISGGYQNAVQSSADNSFIGGGIGNMIQPGAHEATIAGGSHDSIGTNDYNAFVGGGWNNVVQNNAQFAAIGGGLFNFNNGAQAVIAGGQGNIVGGAGVWGTISGGYSNTVTATLATIPGGDQNVATNNAFAAGHRAKASNPGSFVWADATEADFSSTTSNQFAVRANGGVAFVTGGAGMTVDGLNVVSGAGLTNFWQLNGNNGTTAGANFVGTTDNQPLEIHVKGQRALRLEPDNTGPGAPNVIGGANGVATGAYGDTIGGGYQNTNGGNYSVIGGGSLNQIPPGVVNAVIAGGNSNLVLGAGIYSTIGGGANNTNFAPFATIPGGLNNLAGANAFAAGTGAQAGNQGSFVWADASGNGLLSTNNNSVTMRAAGGFQFYTTSLGRSGAGLYVPPGGVSWIAISDRNAKKNFRPVDGTAVLEKLAAIPVEQWNYKWENDSDTPNIGPMAQDFIHAFYPGRDDKGISTLEFDGVELAAIQGLNQKVEVRSEKAEGQIEELKAENANLKARLEKLEQLINSMNGGTK